MGHKEFRILDGVIHKKDDDHFSEDMPKIYIAGAIRNHEPLIEQANRAKFLKGEEMVLKLFSNAIIFNPVYLDREEHGLSFEQIMEVDIATVMQCDYIYMLKGWEKSIGAIAEHAVAVALGIIIIYQ